MPRVKTWTAGVIALLAIPATVLIVHSQDGRSGPEPTGGHSVAEPVVAAGITQQRRDQIKRVVSLRITASDSAPITVTDARLIAPGFTRQSDVAWNHRPVIVQPDVPVALPISLAPADCEPAAVAGPAHAKVTFVDAQGRLRTVDIADTPDSGLLKRIGDHDCAVALLEERVTLTLGSRWRAVASQGQLTWHGFIEIQRRAPFSPPIEVAEILGSVLVDLEPIAPLPWRIPDRTSSRLHVEARSSGRCDGHSMGESSKPFVFTIWVTTGGTDVALVLSVPKEQSPAWWKLLTKACARADRGAQ